MQLALADGRIVELGYCYNVLPGESVGALVAQLQFFCGPVRRELGVARLGVGLWIAHDAARELASKPSSLRAFANVLAHEQLYCFTLNGFPYGGFHAPRVKERVFLPSWAEEERVAYTLDLGTILAELLPDDVARGSISTVPIGPADTDRAAARDGLRRCADGLARLSRPIELAVEPEPGAGFERARELAEYLDGTGAGICFDCCHAAVIGEDPSLLSTVRAAKIQISSALVCEDPARDIAWLKALDEPRYFHQVRSARGGAMDLPDALASLDRTTPWRIHFHVPVHRAELGGFWTTRDSIGPALAAALAAPGEPPHLEVETYTWGVLPGPERAGDDRELIEGIASELRWAIDQLAALGAKPR